MLARQNGSEEGAHGGQANDTDLAHLQPYEARRCISGKCKKDGHSEDDEWDWWDVRKDEVTKKDENPRAESRSD